MSDNEQVGYTPAKPSKLTPAEFRELGVFFKELIESTSLAKWVIAAGVGAILEGLHILWLAARFLLHR